MSDQHDLANPTRVHIIGVGGAGMRAIASVLVAMGHEVSGSDLRDSRALDRLRAEGVTVTVGHNAANIGNAEVVTRSTAVPDANPEVQAAISAGVPVLSRATALSAITRARRTIAVAGTHGKTTTSSMLAVILREAGIDPSFIIGGELNEIGSGAVWAETDGWFIAEADESDGTFLDLDARRAIVTSVEPDHLAYYGSEQALVDAFGQFVDAVAEVAVVCLDDAGAAGLVGDGSNVTTYGTSEQADWTISSYSSDRAFSSFTLISPDGTETDIQLGTPGLHNVRNATAAIVTAVEIGVDMDDARRALAKFGGVARRFQYRGSRDDITFIDDYAHLPTEVAAALEAAGGGDWGRVVCVFQPHRFTRTAELWEDFASAFQGADVLVVTSIYASGEAPIPGVNAKLIVDAVTKAHPDQAVAFIPHREELRTYLTAQLRAGDLCLTLGAGDLTTLPDELLGP